ncbi:hypothetical protein EBB07_01195 [Paenibacillaceae bacterium]|nr:hypothetical protein EBB07_01195 [Paenibacillaceae bacterium]
MRVPPFERYGRALQLAGIFLLGVLAGVVLFNSFYLYQFDSLYNQMEELESHLETKSQEIKLLNRYKNQHTVIKSIEIYIEENPNTTEKAQPGMNSRTETELKKRIRSDLDVFIGRSIYEIASEGKLARMLLNQKKYSGGILEEDYSIEVKTMLVVDNLLKVWVKAKVHTPN